MATNLGQFVLNIFAMKEEQEKKYFLDSNERGEWSESGKLNKKKL